jgi:signal transduction histidine kinase
MRLRLGTKIAVAIVGIVVLAVASCLGALFAAWKVEALQEQTAAENVPSVRATDDLQAALLEQRELLSCYLLDQGNPMWLERLREVQPHFRDAVAQIRNTHLSDKEVETLAELEKVYAELSTRREEAISLYQQKRVDQARAVLTDFDKKLNIQAEELWNELSAANDRDLEEMSETAALRVQQATWGVSVLMALTVGLSGALMWLFFRGVIHPLRGMAADVRLFRGDSTSAGPASVEDELRAVGEHLRSLMSDVSHTRSRLDWSQSRLLSAEKLASVGKLAAGVAHEIRSPLTAMKMWLFSIQEAVSGNPELEHKLAIVAEEMARLERIIGNFLEFSRPPALKRRAQGIAGILDQTLELLGPRLKQEKTRVVRRGETGLPPVMADAEQLKQVLINLLQNAVEATGPGGEVQVATAAERDGDGRPMVVVRVRDTGPGIPLEVQGRIFEPFYTTKDHGTGLGLCIAAQIMAQHEGLLVLESSSGRGTVFAVWTPVA